MSNQTVSERDFWQDRTRIELQPIAPPSILGLYGFAGATLIVAAHLANWYGDSASALYLFPFAAMFGGLAQLLAGMWAYRARDGLATAMHGMWGSFWLGYGLLHLLFALDVLIAPAAEFPELGWWFIALAAITWVGAVAAAGENLVLTGVLGALALGATVAAPAEIMGSEALSVWAGYIFIVSAVLAWYLASAMMLEGTYGRVILPIGKYKRAANVPGATASEPIQYEKAMPGVREGQ